jgi:hypothetical protein
VRNACHSRPSQIINDDDTRHTRALALPELLRDSGPGGVMMPLEEPGRLLLRGRLVGRCSRGSSADGWERLWKNKRGWLDNRERQPMQKKHRRQAMTKEGK